MERRLASLPEKLTALQKDASTILEEDLESASEEKLVKRLPTAMLEKGQSFVQGKGTRKSPEQRLLETAQSLYARRSTYETYLAIMGSRNSFSKTDPDATFMRMKEDHMIHKGAEKVQKEILLLAMGFNLNKLHNRNKSGRLGIRLFKAKHIA